MTQRPGAPGPSESSRPACRRNSSIELAIRLDRPSCATSYLSGPKLREAQFELGDAGKDRQLFIRTKGCHSPIWWAKDQCRFLRLLLDLTAPSRYPDIAAFAE